jgi:DNA end-binding protein Ku
VELSKSELSALDAVASDEIAITEFVPASAVDPLFFEHHYYLGAGKGGDRAYQLFRDALDDAELVAIASYAARGKQYIVLLRPYQTGLAMHQLRYPDEVKPWSEVPAIKHTKAAAAELALARQVIDNLRHDTFDPGRYKDEVKARVRALIATKAKGGEITAPPTAERAPVTDLMAALKASLGAATRGGKHNGAPRAAAGKPTAHAAPRRSHRTSNARPRPGARPHARTSRAAAPRSRAHR